MTTEKEEHPAARAARLIKELYEQNITMITNGFVFTRTNEDGSIEDVSELIRQKSLEQIAACDEVIRRAPGMNEELTFQADGILGELEHALPIPGEKPVEGEDPLPEMGNYEH